jgi:hypothetical protein
MRFRAAPQLAPRSGTVTLRVEFTAHPDGFEAEDTDEPHHQKPRISG